jgi:hypothetical protein
MSSFVNLHGSEIRRRNSCLRLNTVFQIIQVYKSEFEFPNRSFGFYAADIGMLNYINISSFELYASFGRWHRSRCYDNTRVRISCIFYLENGLTAGAEIHAIFLKTQKFHYNFSSKTFFWHNRINFNAVSIIDMEHTIQHARWHKQLDYHVRSYFSVYIPVETNDHAGRFVLLIMA